MHIRVLAPVLVMIVSALGGCVGSPANPIKREAQFIEAEYSPYERTGSGVLVGQAFLVTAGGDVKYGAGRQVLLNPVTSYSDEWYQKSVVPCLTIEPSDPRVHKYTRYTMADGEGRFRFTDLPPGDYYAVCAISWVFSANGTQTGGYAHAKVTIRDGQTTEVILTDPIK